MRSNIICGIYKITSPSGKVYIGQSVDINRRIERYKKKRCKGQPILYNSILKYGWENHNLEIVCRCSINLLNEMERTYQDKCNAVGTSGLNCRATKSSDKTGYLSHETKKKLSEKLKGKKRSHQQIEAMSIRNKGRFIGLKSPTSYRIVSENIFTGEKIINTLSNTAKYFNVDRGLIMSRLKGLVGNKLKDWDFYKEGESKPMIIPNNSKNTFIFNPNTGVYYYSFEDAAKSLEIDINWKTLWYRIKNNKERRFIVSK